MQKENTTNKGGNFDQPIVKFQLPDGNTKREELQDALKRVRLPAEYINGHSQGFADCYNWIHSLLKEGN